MNANAALPTEQREHDASSATLLEIDQKGQEVVAETILLERLLLPQGSGCDAIVSVEAMAAKLCRRQPELVAPLQQRRGSGEMACVFARRSELSSRKKN